MVSVAHLQAIGSSLLAPNIQKSDKHMTDIDEDDPPMLPETLWPYVKSVRYHYNYNGDHYIDKLIYAIPRMSRLHTFIIHTLTTPPDALIDVLFHCPSLVELSFEETPLDFHLPPAPCESLRKWQFNDGRDLRVSGSPRFFIRSWRSEKI